MRRICWMRWRWDAGEALPAAEAAQYVQIWGRRIPETELAIPIYAAVQRGKPQAAVRYGRQQPEGRPAETAGAAAIILILAAVRQRKSADAVSLP